MKIITIEEHVSDPDIARACQQRSQAESPYFMDWVKASRDIPELLSQDFPHLVGAQTAITRAADMGEQRLANMDACGIDMQILSYSNSPQLLDPEQAIPLTRAANDRLAAAVAAHPDRFGAFATLPWSDPHAAARELERTVTQLGFCGALLTGRPGNTFLDDPFYGPVLAAAEALNVPIYTHPGVPLPAVQQPYYGGFSADVSARLSMFGWGWHAEGGVQIIRMILSGVFDKYPRLQIIAGHWGEMVPFYLARMDEALPQEVTGLTRTITDTFIQHFYITPSGMLNRPHMQFTLDVVGVDRIIYAVDYPYLTNKGARDFLETAPISQQDKEKIAHRNAETLFNMQPQ
ncbi:amidohydrolase [Shimwellia pseudoproteus]|uniref:amidohydrolase family protein n=1 Tax=Shimwellia pseudoproteus TaxID=570012 RepID=UPI0018EA384B|nr:amidohydrolase family protein [Shimwellia pseudoproteus]MBJ3816868.1 amidohydrolase [Shimwellia pseudoproteus]